MQCPDHCWLPGRCSQAAWGLSQGLLLWQGLGTAGGEEEVWQKGDSKGGKRERLGASEQVMGQEFGQEIHAGRAEAAADPLGSEEASQHILDLKGNIQIKTGFKGGNCSLHHSMLYSGQDCSGSRACSGMTRHKSQDTHLHLMGKFFNIL